MSLISMDRYRKVRFYPEHFREKYDEKYGDFTGGRGVAFMIVSHSQLC